MRMLGKMVTVLWLLVCCLSAGGCLAGGDETCDVCPNCPEKYGPFQKTLTNSNLSLQSECNRSGQTDVKTLLVGVDMGSGVFNTLTCSCVPMVATAVCACDPVTVPDGCYALATGVSYTLVVSYSSRECCSEYGFQIVSSTVNCGTVKVLLCDAV